MVKGGGGAVEGGNLTGREQGVPPADAQANVANDEEAGEGNDQEQEDGAGPAQAVLQSVAAEHAGFSDVGGKGGPTAVIVDDLTGGGVGFEESLGPILGVEAEGAGVSADDAFGEDAAWQEAKAILLQRHQVVLADFSDRRYFFQRNAAGEPLHAQVFTKVAHLQP